MAAAAFVAGCGGGGSNGDGDGLARTALAAKADAVCKRANADTLKIRRPVSFAEPRQAERYFTAAVTIAERQQRDLAALEPATATKAAWRAFLAEERTGLTLLRTLRDRAAAGDGDGVIAKLGALVPTDNAISEKADALGALQCGSAGG